MKKFLLISVSIFISSVVLIFFLPMIASTSLGKRVVLSVISQQTGADLDASSWDFSWFGPQTIRNASFKSENLEFSFTNLQTDLPFYSFLKLTQFDPKVISNLNGVTTLDNGKFTINNSGNESVSVKNIDLKLYGSEKKYINIDLKGKSQVDQVSGSIALNSKFEDNANLFNADSPTRFKIVTDNFPTKSIDRFFQVLKIKPNNSLFSKIKNDPNFFFSLLGSKVSANVLVENENNIEVVAAEFKSSNLKASLNGKLQNEKFYLNQDFKVTYQLSNSLLKEVLKESNPLFVTSVEFLNPITFKIYKDGAQFPIDFNIQNISIPKATLDVGKFKCENKKTLAIILGLLKLHQFENINDMTVSFSPFNFRIKDGILSSDKTAVLIADNIQVYTQGDINLNNNKMDMLLGFPENTLQNIFKIKNLSKEFVLQIPLKGTLKKPKVNLEKAAAKLASLIASDKVDKKFPEISEFIDILIQFDKKKDPVN